MIGLLTVLVLSSSGHAQLHEPSDKDKALASCAAPGLVLKVEVIEPVMPKRTYLYFCTIPKMVGKDQYAPTTEWTYKLLGREIAAPDKNITDY